MTTIGTRVSTAALRARLGLSQSTAPTRIGSLRLVAPRRSSEYFQPIVQVPPQVVEGREATLYVRGADGEGGFRGLTPIRPVRPRRDGDEVSERQADGTA